MRRVSARAGAGVALLAVLAVSSTASAIDSDAAKGRAKVAIRTASSGVSKIAAAGARAKRSMPTPAKRIAAGDILLRNGDYERAIVVFNQVVELHRQGKATENAAADATFLLGEAYFQDEQLLSAQRHFRTILENGTRSPYDSYAGRALSRLVDIALRRGDTKALEFVTAKLGSLPASDASGSLQYARAKASFASGDYSTAERLAGSVPVSTDFGHQAQYLLGVVYVKQAAPQPAPEPTPQEAGDAKDGAEGAAPTPIPEQPKPLDIDAERKRYAKAVAQFRRVTKMSADTSRQRHVVDLAWMAIGRLFYESEGYLDAAEAYSHVDRKSPEFTNMLYELAWTYVRLGDYQRAMRSLEVYSIADPKSLNLADGSLLRADLMLRSGQYDKALQMYESVRSKFDPIREQVDTFLKSTTDPAVYYDMLVEDRMEDGTQTGKLPPIVVKWARDAAEGDRVFAMIDDVARSRALVVKSRRLALKLNAALSSGTKAKAFPELEAQLKYAEGLINQVAMARLTLAKGLDDENSSSLSGEIGKVRAERRSLMKRMGWLPVTDGDFSRRDVSGDRQWRKLSQELQRLTLAADKLQAIVNGLKRVLKEGDQHGVTKDSASRQRFEAEIAANERDLASYRKRIKRYQEAVELGKAQIGFGDQRYVDDARVRERFKVVFNKEVALAAGGAAGGGSASYARAIQPILSEAERVEGQLVAARDKLRQVLDEKSEDLRKKVAAESAALEGYATRLEELDQNARLLVGEVAMRNFSLVRERLKSIVLRADVGIVQHAWEVRESHRMRLRGLQRERAREERNLNDELREVLDDAGEF